MDAQIAALIRAAPAERLDFWTSATPGQRFLLFYRPGGGGGEGGG
jgi:hypothetical protein